MSEKPSWCDESVWQLCHGMAIDAILGGSEQEVMEIIAKVGMQARNIGVEEAARLCERRGDWGKETWDEYVASGKTGPATSYHQWFYSMADFIRLHLPKPT